MPERISIPSHLTIANIRDFYDAKGNPRIGMKFEILTYHSVEFEEHTIRTGEDIMKYYPWIRDNHAFLIQKRDQLLSEPDIKIIKPKMELNEY